MNLSFGQKSELSSHQISMHGSCGLSGGPRTSTLSSYDGDHFSNGEIAVFPLGMAILNLTDLHQVERPPFFSLLALYLFFGLPGMDFFTGMAVLTIRGTPWYPFRRYAGNSTFNQHNLVFPPSGHWNLGTLEPRVHREEKGHRPENRQRAPTQGTAFFRYPLGRRRRFLHCLVHGQAAHGGYDVLGRCMLLAGAVFGLFFPRL